MALIDEQISTLTWQLSCRSDHALYGTIECMFYVECN